MATRHPGHVPSHGEGNAHRQHQPWPPLSHYQSLAKGGLKKAVIYSGLAYWCDKLWGWADTTHPGHFIIVVTIFWSVFSVIGHAFHHGEKPHGGHKG